MESMDLMISEVAPPGMTALDARLGVPSDAVARDYRETVVLTFSNNI